MNRQLAFIKKLCKEFVVVSFVTGVYWLVKYEATVGTLTGKYALEGRQLYWFVTIVGGAVDIWVACRFYKQARDYADHSE